MSAALFRGIMSGSAAAMGPLSSSSPFSPSSIAPSPVDLSAALIEASKAKKSRTANESDDEDMMKEEDEDDDEDVDVDDEQEERDVSLNPKIGTHRKSLINHHRTNHRFSGTGHRRRNGHESPSSDSITEGEEEDKPLDLTLKWVGDQLDSNRLD